MPVVLLAAMLSAAGCGVLPDAELEPEMARDRVTISLIATNDIHGHIEQLPLLAGYVNNVRAVRALDGGVVLLDAGDMFQGTLESNVGEGDVLIEALNAMEYSAAAIGNHEFDFGPLGELAVPRSPGDNPRGALEERASEAEFPLLTANIRDRSTGQRVDWTNAPPSTLVEVRGILVGIVGVSSMSTPRTTTPANFVGLEMTSLEEAIVAESGRLRKAGAVVVVVLAHAGARCDSFDDPLDLGSCATDGEVFELARALPEGLVDVIVAGHDHNGIAHFIGRVAVIQSFMNGRAFGRVDLVVEKGRVVSTVIFPPQQVCTGSEIGSAPGTVCEGGVYEGAAVQPDPRVGAIHERAAARAIEIRNRFLGAETTAVFAAPYSEESPVGNLFTDLMLLAEPEAEVAITNGGGLRAELPAGPLTYGDLYEASPFDNRFAFLTISGAELSQLIAWNLRQKYGIFSLAGVRAVASCRRGEMHVELARTDGSRVEPGELVRVVTSDYLATGGDGFPVERFPPEAVEIPGSATIRDAMAEVLRKRGGTLRPQDFYDPERPRLSYPERPMRCD